MNVVISNFKIRVEIEKSQEFNRTFLFFLSDHISPLNMLTTGPRIMYVFFIHSSIS